MPMLDRDLAKYATDRLLELLETEGSNWRQSWCGSGEQMNFVTRKPYRNTNQFLLGVAGKPSPLWATYRQFSEAGLQVAKGSKSMPIFFFKPHSVKDRETEEEKKIIVLRTYNVFNLSDLTKPPDIKIEKRRPDIEIDAKAERLVAATGADLRIGGDKAFYSPTQDFVAMPHRNQFDTKEDYYSTLWHELGGHWTGHQSRLDRNLSGRFGTEAYAMEEILAQAASAFLCVHIGIVPAPRKQDAQYINNWKAALRADKLNVLTIFSHAQRAAYFILKDDTPAPEAEPTRPENEPSQPPTTPTTEI
jgi:antirestriction protein ArdC